jgi:hypothetical protein
MPDSRFHRACVPYSRTESLLDLQSFTTIMTVMPLVVAMIRRSVVAFVFSKNEWEKDNYLYNHDLSDNVFDSCPSVDQVRFSSFV